jgi:hypothetical protein
MRVPWQDCESSVPTSSRFAENGANARAGAISIAPRSSIRSEPPPDLSFQTATHPRNTGKGPTQSARRYA